MVLVEIIYTDTFLRDAHRLPRDVQQHLLTQEAIFRTHPRDPRLHTKMLHGRLEGLLSFRITRNYRVLYRRAGSIVYFFLAVDDRKDIYR